MTTQSQRNRDGTVFLVSQNAVITAPIAKVTPTPPPLSTVPNSNGNQKHTSRNGPTGIFVVSIV